jgi:hypothetical protein
MLWLTASIVGTTLFLVRRNVKWLIITLSIVLSGGVYNVCQSVVFKKGKLTVFQEDNHPAIAWEQAGTSFNVDSLNTHRIIFLNGKKWLSVTSDRWANKQSAEKYAIDYLHIAQGNDISLYSLTKVFDIRSAVIGDSLSAKSRRRLIGECEKLKIPCYDMSAKGFFRINF